MFFSVSTKILNRGIFTKNLAILLKDGMGLRMKNFNIMGFHWKIWFLRGLYKKPIYRGELPKKGRHLDSLQISLKERELAKKRADGVFKWGGGLDTPMHTMN